jgi:nucleotide-binding universal stress UspA family protein
MPDTTNSQRQAATDALPPVSLHPVVGYDGSHTASRALDAAAALLQGRDGSIDVVYVAHLPGVDMLSADAIVGVRADFDEIEKGLLASAAAQLDGRGITWEFRRRNGLIAEELIAAATASREARPGGTTVIVVGSSFHVSHRVIGSVAVSLARHCPVPLVIVP